MKQIVTKADTGRLAGEAAHIIAMFESVYKDPKERLKMASAMAGFACHQAVRENGEPMIDIVTTDGSKYYFGDALNGYLLEDPISVLGFMQGYYDTSAVFAKRIDVEKYVKNAITYLGDDSYKIWGQYDPKVLYNQAKSCWFGIFNNMTSKYCKHPSEWPVLFGIVLQNVMFQVKLDPEEVFNMALECALFISKMCDESLENAGNSNKQADAKEEVSMYDLYRDGQLIEISPEDKEYIKVSMDAVIDFLKDNEMTYEVGTSKTSNIKVIVYKMLLREILVDIIVAIELKPRMCRIEFIMPFKVNPIKASMICMALTKYNYKRRFGAFFYDIDEGEISYRMPFPCTDGIKKDDFIAAFIISMNSVSEYILDLKKLIE